MLIVPLVEKPAQSLTVVLSNQATQLAIYQTRYGDWKELFQSVDRIDKVTKADIRRIANQIFTENNRTVGTIETAAQKGAQQ